MLLLGEVELPLPKILGPHESQRLDLLHPVIASFFVLFMVVKHGRDQATPLTLVLHLVSQNIKHVLPTLVKPQHL